MYKKIITITLIFIAGIFLLIITNKSIAYANPKTLAQTIIELCKGDTYAENSGNGVYQTNSHEYRYVGGDVNNFVEFNNDLYRIIGVFDSNSHGVTGKQLVKLIRINNIINASWGAVDTIDNDGLKNDWTGSTTGVKANANVLLNEIFLYANEQSNIDRCANYTYIKPRNSIKTNNCSIIKKYGIKTNNIRNLIEDTTWYLYGPTGSIHMNKHDYYQCERNNYSTCKSGNNGAYSGTTIQKIGLMYTSDYLYASGFIASNDTTTLSDDINYYSSNWINNGYEWTITPRGQYNAILKSSIITNWGCGNAVAIRPTFYLKEQVYVTGGNGSFDDPYTIACDNCSS